MVLVHVLGTPFCGNRLSIVRYADLARDGASTRPQVPVTVAVASSRGGPLEHRASLVRTEYEAAAAALDARAAAWYRRTGTAAPVGAPTAVDILASFPPVRGLVFGSTACGGSREVGVLLAQAASSCRRQPSAGHLHAGADLAPRLWDPLSPVACSGRLLFLRPYFVRAIPRHPLARFAPLRAPRLGVFVQRVQRDARLLLGRG